MEKDFCEFFLFAYKGWLETGDIEVGGQKVSLQVTGDPAAGGVGMPVGQFVVFIRGYLDENPVTSIGPSTTGGFGLVLQDQTRLTFGSLNQEVLDAGGFSIGISKSNKPDLKSVVPGGTFHIPVS
jgi:hypothetical protein